MPISLSTKQREALVQSAIEKYARTPFQNELVKALLHSPLETSIQSFANDHPDKWANMVLILSRLSGYNEELIVRELPLDPANMSDAELYQRLSDLRDNIQKGNFIPPAGAAGASNPVQKSNGLSIEHKLALELGVENKNLTKRERAPRAKRSTKKKIARQGKEKGR